MPANHAYRFIAEPDEMNEISMEKWCVKFVVGENGRNPKKAYPDSVSSIM